MKPSQLHSHCQIFLILALSLVASSVARAQAPDIAPWSGGTALAQAQGFGMGNPITLTWGFAALGTSINDSAFNGGFADAPNTLQTRLDAIYGNQATWQPLFESSFSRWSAVSGLGFQFEAADDGAAYIINTNQVPLGQVGVRADMRIGGKPLDGNSGVLAYNFFPNTGDMVIDTNDNFFNDTSSNSIRLRNVLAHEIGHGIGMAHVVCDGSCLMAPFIDTSFDGPQYHDILVAQRGYGDAFEKSNGGLGNDIVARASSLGAIADGGSVTLGNSARSLTVTASTTDFVSIDDSSDTDFYSFSVASGGSVSIQLEALGFTYNTTPQTGGSTVSFNTAQRSDLRFSLFDTDGTTVLANVNNTGLGGMESLFNFSLTSGGTYFVRVNGTNNADTQTIDTQFYGLNVSYAVVVPEPLSLVLMGGGGLLLLQCGVRRRGR